jgi:hypothetical protein
MPFVSPAWPTSDHVIPCRIFESGYRCIRRILAMQRLSMARAVELGDLLAHPMTDKVSEARSRATWLLKPHVDEAYPAPGAE